jgi:hypothetical protein
MFKLAKQVIKKFIVASVLLLPVITVVDVLAEGVAGRHLLIAIWSAYCGLCLVWAVAVTLWFKRLA